MSDRLVSSSQLEAPFSGSVIETRHKASTADPQASEDCKVGCSCNAYDEEGASVDELLADDGASAERVISCSSWSNQTNDFDSSLGRLGTEGPGSMLSRRITCVARRSMKGEGVSETEAIISGTLPQQNSSLTMLGH